METTVSEDVQQLCTFHVGPLFLGVDVRVVQEVIRYQEMTPVPLAKNCVEGLINLRGQIVTALDLRVQMGLPPSDSEELPMNVVISIGDTTASLLVDEIGDVVDIDPKLLEPPPATLPASASRYITSVFKMEDTLLLLLSAAEAIRTGDNEKARPVKDSDGA
jgi:purine-binding chemotaxis protein CheW